MSFDNWALFVSCLLSLGISGLSGLSFSGCANPFSTRTPEPPEQNNSTFIDPITPQDVFLNLQIAFNERNVETYLRCFVDTSRSQQRFEFVPDAEFAGQFFDWGLENERRYFQQMLQVVAADSLLRVNFDIESSSETASTATITQNYTIEIRHTRQNEFFSGTVRGQGLFFLERDQDGDWAIYRWVDTKSQDFASWTRLKVEF